MSRNWSQYQENIFAFISQGTGNAIVTAVAGSGKTTTIVHGMSLINPRDSSIFLAFNKSIADELRSRGVNARTFHSLTYSPVTKHKGARVVDPDKLRKLCDLNLKGRDSIVYGAFICKLVGLGRQTGIGCLVPDVTQSWLDICTYHDMEPEHDEADLGRALVLASDLLTWSNESPMVDFDDLLYIAVKDGLSLPRFDYVFVDEAQDTNAIQRALLRKVMHAKSRMVAVGDPAQAIYGFRGADSESINMIRDEFECIELPLTVSYRCPTSVVEFAQQYVKHIEAAPDAPEGVVKKLGTKWKHDDLMTDDLIVCRTTKPLVTLAFRLLKNRIPAFIMGREVGQGMKSLINKMRTSDIDKLEELLLAYTEREVEKATAKKQDSKVEAIHDKTDAILTLAHSLPEDNRTVPELLRVIDALFAEGVGKVKLATIHKAKGLEARRVYWLNSSQCPSKWARQDWQKKQEINLCYVAVTRAKEELILIEEERAQ
jgi:DNA helicase-2/ATP-dependent DNA helicase PcrA